MFKKKYRNKIFILLSVIFTFVMVLGIIYTDNTNIDYEYYEIGDGEVNVRLLHLSDIHFPKEKVDIKLLLEKIIEIDPDAICITGDLINRDAKVEECGVFEFIEQIIDIAVVLYVTGNHEEANPEKDILITYLKEKSVYVLENKNVNLKLNNKRIAFMGLNDDEDFSSYYYDTYLANYKVLLAHRPSKEKYRTYVNGVNPANLVLTGHYHGGQIRIFNRGILVPDEGLFPKNTAGLLEFENSENTKMIISRGIGSSAFPFRINNNPNVIIIDLKL